MRRPQKSSEPDSDAAPAETSLALVSDLDELEQVEEKILASRLAGEESVATYLYCILPDEQNRLPKPIVGPTADFVVQLVRRINQASRGRVKLKLLHEPPVVTDFTVPDDRGRQIPFVRVIVGAIDEATGEVCYGIKEMRRAGKDPVGVAHTRAIRRAFEIHPSYNRKVVGKFIREKLRELGYDPAKFVVQAGAAGGEWGKFFAMARAQGVESTELRAAVREKTGKGLSEVATAQEADAAAQAIHQTLQHPAGTVQESSQVQPTAPEARSVPDEAPRPAATVRTVATPPDPGHPGLDDTAAIANLRAQCAEYIRQVGLEPAAVDRLWKNLRPAGNPNDLTVQRLRYRRLFAVLYALSIGEKEQAAVRSALEQQLDPHAVHVAVSSAGTREPER